MEDLRVWWIPQIPLSKDDEPFYVNVGSPKEGKMVLDALSTYDVYQYNHNIKPDYTNTGGLEELNENEIWNEWENVFGDTIDDLSIEDLE